MNRPNSLYIDAAVQDSPNVRQIRERLPDIPTEVISDLTQFSYAKEFTAGKQRWLLSTLTPHWLKPLAPTTTGVVRLGAVLTVNAPYECSYCPLQVVLADTPIIHLAMNIEKAIAELATRFAGAPRQQFRVQVGLNGDALALDHITQLSHMLVPFFALMPNASLELRTRTDNIAQLLQLAHHGHTVISFAINPRALITSEERGTASLLERLIAARRCLNAGYRVAFAIDPIIQCPNWQRLYAELLEELFTHIPAEACDGIDLSCLHYPKGLPEVALKQFPGSHIFFGELVPVKGEYRYFRPIREELYHWFSSALAQRQIPVHALAASA